MAVLPSRKCDSDWVWWVLKFTPLTLWRGCEGDSAHVKLTRLKMSYCLRETSSFSLYSDFFTVSLQRCFWAAENKPCITIKIFAEHFIYSESARRVVLSHSQTSRAKPSGRALRRRWNPAGHRLKTLQHRIDSVSAWESTENRFSAWKQHLKNTQGWCCRLQPSTKIHRPEETWAIKYLEENILCLLNHLTMHFLN